MPSLVEAVNSSGSRSEEGSSWSRCQDCISRRASKAVGLSAALEAERTVRGRLAAERERGLPLLPSWWSLMTRFVPSRRTVASQRSAGKADA